MRNLFWKKPNKNTVALDEVLFETEDDFEKYIISNTELLPDVFIAGSQVISKSGRPDIIGIDNENNVVIIEMKNVQVDENIIPQVLRYAIWAESNPDSIKSWWLELKEKPEEIDISWNDFEVKILVIAPKIKNSVLNYVNKIDYQVDLLEINKFMKGDDEFILIEQLETEKEHRKTIAKPKPEYNREFYKEHHNINSIPGFYETIDKVEKMAEEQKWSLKKKFNKDYVGFKHGFFNVFGIKWIGTLSYGVFLKIPEKIAKGIEIEGLEPYRYEKQWDEVLYKIDRPNYPLEKLLPLFQEAYKHVTGLET